MKYDALKRRLDALQPSGGTCPHCRALDALSDAELDARIQSLMAGKGAPGLPEPSPTCPNCKRIANMTEEEQDAGLTRLLRITEKSI
jgi:hypothetical protein